jgi:very-short-patch-repair endonuclease
MSITRARDLRTNMTDAERRLWRTPRSRQLEGLRFRRQFHIGHYIADFACPDLRLVVEVDGGQHADSAYDAARDAWMQERGWTVLRFWNNEVMENPEGVFAAIGIWARERQPNSKAPPP